MLTFVAGLALVSGLIWLLRRQGGRPDMRRLERELDGRGPAPRAEPEPVGTDLAGVKDSRFAAAVLLIQIARTGTLVTGAERSCILALMGQPLGVAKPLDMYAAALECTAPRRPLEVPAAVLLPLLRAKLDRGERLQLVDMLIEVANAYIDASALQLAQIELLKQRLLAT